jgi:HlyD family secretion protein
MFDTSESIEEISESDHVVAPPEKTRWYKRWSVLLVLAILAVIAIGVSRAMKNGKAGDQSQYMLSAARIDTVKKTVTATGVLMPWTVVDIKSKAGGRIDSLPVTEGTIVKKGQLIAEIDPSDTLLTYNQAKADIAANQAQVDQARKNLALQEKESVIGIQSAQAGLRSAQATARAAKARYDSSVSQSKAQGPISQSAVDSAQAALNSEKARLDQMTKATNPQSLAAAKAALNQAQANLTNAKAQIDRNKTLFTKGFVAKAQVDQAQANYDVALATFQSAQEKVQTIAPELEADLTAERAKVNQAAAALETAKANQVQVQLSKQTVASAWADYQQALAGVRQAQVKVNDAKAQQLNNSIRAAQIRQQQASGARAQASMTNAQTQLDQTRVTAPSDGIILQKYVEQGTLITSGVSFNSTGTSIVQMGDVSRMYVDVQVDETDIASVDLGQSVDITFDAYPTTPFEGKVIKIDPQAVVENNVTTIHVRVEVDNSVPSFRLLKPQMNASCDFVVGKKDNVLCVPNDAIKTDDDGSSYVEIARGGRPAPPDPGSQPDPNLVADIKKTKRTVEIGLEGNEDTEILSGLKEGDKVVTQEIQPVAKQGSAVGGRLGGRR